MSATDELRAELTKRGVEWEAPASFDGTARYDTTAGCYWFHEFNGKITIHGLTPAQAIAATLGTETCHNADIGAEGYFKCSECGASCSVDWERSGWGEPRHCPNCGRKVVGE